MLSRTSCASHGPREPSLSLDLSCTIDAMACAVQRAARTSLCPVLTVRKPE